MAGDTPGGPGAQACERCALRFRDGDRDITDIADGQHDEQLGRAVRLIFENGQGALVFDDGRRVALRRLDP
jgi:hypothetical protein